MTVIHINYYRMKCSDVVKLYSMSSKICCMNSQWKYKEIKISLNCYSHNFTHFQHIFPPFYAWQVVSIVTYHCAYAWYIYTHLRGMVHARMIDKLGPMAILVDEKVVWKMQSWAKHTVWISTYAGVIWQSGVQHYQYTCTWCVTVPLSWSLTHWKVAKVKPTWFGSTYIL